MHIGTGGLIYMLYVRCRYSHEICTYQSIHYFGFHFDQRYSHNHINILLYILIVAYNVPKHSNCAYCPDYYYKHSQ